MISLTDFLHKIIKWLATITLATMMILTFLDVNLRYWLGEPILGSNEMTEFLLGTVVMSGLVIVSGERSHIAVTLFEPFLQRKIPVIYKWLGILVNLIGILAVTYLIIHYTFFMHSQGNETEIREWQWWWLGTLLSTLCFFAVLMAIRSIWSPLENSMTAEDNTELTGERSQQ
ncbi:MAG: TRAP transporter small permease subunit [Rhodospirillales bacterium]|nr:TRAP transporter small permease subunit [Rhodospirillales bacterium]